jgi:hypothetical protein
LFGNSKKTQYSRDIKSDVNTVTAAHVFLSSPLLRYEKKEKKRLMHEIQGENRKRPAN